MRRSIVAGVVLILSGALPACPARKHASPAAAGTSQDVVAPPGPAPTAGRRAPIRFATEVSYTASLLHFIDSLAGTSGGKTVPDYQHAWERRFGAPGPEDRESLLAFRAARRSIVGMERCASTPGESVDPGPGWRIRFLSEALAAQSTEKFLDAIAPCLEPGELEGLRRAIAHFRVGFDKFWNDARFLPEFDRNFQQYLADGDIPHYLDDVASFYDVDPGAAPVPILAFLLLPANGGTHAQQVGRRLLIEVRPRDDPADQVQVICHETSHFLYDLMSPDRRAALDARARTFGPDGLAAWRLMMEALPTALGQGLAVARITPGAFDARVGWYHIPAVDRYAKALYPLVRRAIDHGETIEGPFFEQALRAYRPANGDPSSMENGRR